MLHQTLQVALFLHKFSILCDINLKLHKSTRLGTFYSIVKIAIRIINTETIVKSLFFFAFMMSCGMNCKSSIRIFSLISLQIMQKFKKNQAEKFGGSPCSKNISILLVSSSTLSISYHLNCCNEILL